MSPTEIQKLRQRRAALERLALDYALGPKPSGDGAWDAFDAECASIEREIAAIDAQLVGARTPTETP